MKISWMRKNPQPFFYFIFSSPLTRIFPLDCWLNFWKTIIFVNIAIFFSLSPLKLSASFLPRLFFFNPWNGTRPSHHFTVKWETCDECQQKSRGTKKCKPSMSIFSFKKHCKSGIIEKYLQYVPPLTVVGFTPLAKKKKNQKKRRGWGDFWRRKRERVDLLKWR